MSDINFPTNVVDGTTFFHGNNVCVFHSATNTWECVAVIDETPQPTNQNVYISTSKVYTLGDKRAEWQAKLGAGGISYALPPVQTQEEVNDSIVNLLCYVHGNSTTYTPPTLSVSSGVTEEYLQDNYAPVNHAHSEYVTKAEYNSMVATLMGAIANNASTQSGY